MRVSKDAKLTRVKLALLLIAFVQVCSASTPEGYKDKGGGHTDKKDKADFGEHGDGGGHGDGHESMHVTYEEIYHGLVFLIAIFFAGRLARKLGMPALVGEIITGCLLGPPLLDYVPYAKAFVLVGEIGLIFLILEAGIELDVAQLQKTGTRAIAIGLTGSILPVAVGTGIGMARGDGIKEALALGAAFAPTSLGVAASALVGGGMSNTSVGQLIIASCVVDDIIGLLLLSMFEVLIMKDPQIIDYLIPIMSSFGFLILLGVPGVTVFPKYIQNLYIPLYKKKNRTKAMFDLLAVMTMAYLPLMFYTKSSYLTGAFLAGATFSQIDGAFDAFLHSAHTVMEWLLRIFFAASIGFQVPVKDFRNPKVIGFGFVLWSTCVAVKALVAFFVPRFVRVEKGAVYDPHRRDLVVSALSMTCRGEFSFIIAAFALDKNLMDSDTYAAVVFAVLLSAIVSPFVLLKCIAYYKDLQRRELEASNPMGGDADDTIPLHFHIYIETKNSWSLLSKLQTPVRDLDLKVLDIRTYHKRGLHPVIRTDLYVQDRSLRISLSTVNAQKEFAKALSDITNVADEETGNSMSVVSERLKERRNIEERATFLQSQLFQKIKDLGVSELEIEQWNPWDWTAALDMMGLKRANGQQTDIEFFMKIFDRADTDGNNKLDEEELVEALNDAGMHVTKEGIQAMIFNLDLDGDGELSRDEFNAAVKSYFEKNNKGQVFVGSSSLDLLEGGDDIDSPLLGER